MRIHHLNCTTMCALGGRLIDGRTHAARAPLVCHCLLLELGGGLVLIDTGFGLRDVAHPIPRLSRFFLTEMAPRFREADTAARQVEALGFRREDVRHIVLTHLDFDHAGGLDDFPEAAVHLLRRERDSAEAQLTLLDRMRYRPQQWSSRPRWRVYDGDDGASWFGFRCVRDLAGLPPEILLVPLPGHTLGHAGVAIDTGDGWLLHGGDAWFYYAELDLDEPWCTPGLRLYQTMMEKDRPARLENQRRLRELKRTHGDVVSMFCAHDPTELALVTARVAPSTVRRRPPPRPSGEARPTA
jgi:glyoxylase-like metal-dependent hydrolase (beta-lactamase superfamily II)